MRKNTSNRSKELNFKNKYQYELQLEEYNNCLNRNNRFDYKLSILIAGEILFNINVYCSLFSLLIKKNEVLSNNFQIFQIFTILSFIASIISIVIYVALLITKPEYNYYPYFLEDENKYNKYDENSTVDYITSQIDIIINSRNDNYQLKTKYFNVSCFLFISVIIITSILFLILNFV